MLSAARDRLRATADGDAGISLIELVVAMGLTTIIGAMTLTFFTVSFRSSNATNTSTLNTAGVRVALDAWTSMLRVADSPSAPGTAAGRFTSISPADVVFFADAGNRTNLCTAAACTTNPATQIELQVSADPASSGCFRMVQIIGTGSTATTRYLATGLSQQAVFTYRNALGATTNNPLSVAFVGINVVAGCGTTSSHTFTSSVAITGATT